MEGNRLICIPGRRPPRLAGEGHWPLSLVAAEIEGLPLHLATPLPVNKTRLVLFFSVTATCTVDISVFFVRMAEASFILTRESEGSSWGASSNAYSSSVLVLAPIIILDSFVLVLEPPLILRPAGLILAPDLVLPPEGGTALTTALCKVWLTVPDTVYVRMVGAVSL